MPPTGTYDESATGDEEGEALVPGLGNRVDVRATVEVEDGWRSGFVGEDNCYQMASGIAFSNLQRLF